MKFWIVQIKFEDNWITVVDKSLNPIIFADWIDAQVCGLTFSSYRVLPYEEDSDDRSGKNIKDILDNGFY